jgi:hypothetical protein
LRYLLPHPSVIYDTNCIVYYCFEIQEENALGQQIVVRGANTLKARLITRKLVEAQKSLLTLRGAWLEASNTIIAKALEGEIREGQVQSQLGIGPSVPPGLKFRLARKLRVQLDSLSRERWFRIDSMYRPTVESVISLKEEYARFCADPELQKRIPPYKGNPSDVDIELILYSGYVRVPLLTNDKEIFSFSSELTAKGFCFLIRGFRDVSFEA